MRLGNESPIDIQSRCPGKERLGRLMVADLGMKFGAVSLGNIRRVADDGVEGCILFIGRKCGEQVRPEKRMRRWR